jgi:hypothetical protein
MSPAPCDQRPLVDGHFGPGLSPEKERALRAHLPTCASCHAHYERHLLLARLDPAALSAEDRLGRGLGFAPHREGWFSFASAMPLALAGAAAVLLLLALPLRPHSAGEFTARGAPEGAPAAVEVRVYRVVAGHPEPVGSTIPAEAELAFAYANRAGKRYLMLFGVDEHKHVYWFHPSWTDPAQDPPAIQAEATPALKELPEAVTQKLDGHRLHLVGLFLEQPLSVKQVEALVAASAEGRPHPPGALEWDAELQVGGP